MFSQNHSPTLTDLAARRYAQIRCDSVQTPARASVSSRRVVLSRVTYPGLFVPSCLLFPVEDRWQAWGWVGVWSVKKSWYRWKARTFSWPARTSDPLARVRVVHESAGFHLMPPQQQLVSLISPARPVLRLNVGENSCCRVCLSPGKKSSGWVLSVCLIGGQDQNQFWPSIKSLLSSCQRGLLLIWWMLSGGVTSLWEAAKHQDFKAQQKLLQQTDESVCWDDIKLLFVENMTEMNRHAADTSSITETDRGKKHEKICQVCSCATLVEIWMAEFLWKEIFLLQFRGVF